MQTTFPTIRAVGLALLVVMPLADSALIAQETKTLWVAHRRVDCIGVAPQKCYLIKDDQYDDWRFWYGDIAGFDYEEGYAYEIRVIEHRIENPPADAPAVELELVEVLLKVAADPGVTRPPAATPSPAPTTQPSTPAPPDLAPSATAAPEPDVAGVESETIDAPPIPEAPVKKPEKPQPTTSEPTAPTPTEPETPVARPAAPAPPAHLGPEPQPAPEPTVSGPGTTSAPAAKVPELRGHLTIGSGIETRSFKLCGAEESIWIEDRTDGDLWSMYRELAGYPNRPVYMVVRGSLEAPPLSGFGAHYDQQLVVTEVRHAATESAGCFDDRSQYAYKASGNEPSWNLEISRRGLVLTQMGVEGRTLFPYSPPTFLDSGIVYRSQTGGKSPRTLVVNLDETDCRDTMVDAGFSFTVTLELDGRTLRGCAVRGEAEP